MTVAHVIPTEHEPADLDTLRTGIIAAITAAPVGTPAVWSDGIVTVTIVGASRVYHAWPQTLARVTLTTPDGAETVIEGEDIASWDDLHARVVGQAEDWIAATGWALGHVVALHHHLEQLERQATQARAARNAAIAAARRDGVTGYRLAKATGLSEPAIRTIAPLPKNED